MRSNHLVLHPERRPRRSSNQLHDSQRQHARALAHVRRDGQPPRRATHQVERDRRVIPRGLHEEQLLSKERGVPSRAPVRGAERGRGGVAGCVRVSRVSLVVGIAAAAVGVHVRVEAVVAARAQAPDPRGTAVAPDPREAPVHDDVPRERKRRLETQQTYPRLPPGILGDVPEGAVPRADAASNAVELRHLDAHRAPDDGEAGGVLDGVE